MTPIFQNFLLVLLCFVFSVLYCLFSSLHLPSHLPPPTVITKVTYRMTNSYIVVLIICKLSDFSLDKVEIRFDAIGLIIIIRVEIYIAYFFRDTSNFYKALSRQKSPVHCNASEE